MAAKQSSRILGLSSIALLLSIVLEPALCCSKGQNFAESTNYALDINEETIYRATVKIYSKICTLDVETVGPSWYRLDVLGSARDQGDFTEPWEYSGAVRTSEGLIKFSSEDPLLLLDLPRQYKWEIAGDDLTLQDIKLCFRLVIQEGNSCQQVVTSNCTDELQQQLLLEQQETDNGSTMEGLAPTTAVTTATEAHNDMSNAYLQLCIASNPRLNCTGKRVKPTCGSDGMWYKNTCTLRLHRCIYNIRTLQRDLSNISCTTAPPTYFPPLAPPTTMPPPTPEPCSVVRTNYEQEQFPLVPRCLDHASFRPIQCWRLDGGSIYCTCTDPLTGASYSNSDWIHTCPNPILTQPPPLPCGF